MIASAVLIVSGIINTYTDRRFKELDPEQYPQQIYFSGNLFQAVIFLKYKHPRVSNKKVKKTMPGF
jgi:hypothetical protein